MNGKRLTLRFTPNMPAFVNPYGLPVGFVKPEPGPADIAWAKETLEKARVYAARNLAWVCLLKSVMAINNRWRPPTTLREGPRRSIA